MAADNLTVARVGERRRFRTAWWRAGPLFPLTLAWAGAMAVVAAVAGRNADEVSRLLLDPNYSNGVAWNTGLVSNLGVLTWTVAAAAAFWGAWWCRLGRRREAGRFLFWGGVLGAYLMLDDLFQLHAVWWPRWGAPKVGVELALGFAGLSWMGRFMREMVRTRWVVLAAAALCFAAKVGADRWPVSSSPTTSLLVEDGLKLFGIAAWAAYFVATAADIGRSVLRSATHAGPDDEVGGSMAAGPTRDADGRVRIDL